MKITKFDNLTDAEIATIEGGSLAYELGRIIRFLWISGGSTNPGAAAADWYATGAMN